MRTFCFVFLMLISTVLWASVARAAASPKDQVMAKLFADVKTVQPGKPFEVGVLLKVKPGWHVYWKNPGDSGLPTKVKFTVPEGFQTGELKFPLPVRFDQSGDIIGYGYHDEVLLTVTVTPPANLPAGQPIHLAADVSWLACEKVCIPGKAKLEKELKSGATAEPDNADLFAMWKVRVPESFAATTDVKKHEASINADSVDLAVEFDKPVSEVEWFPAPPSSSDAQDQKAKADGSRWKFSCSIVPPPRQISDMNLVVAFTNQDGKRQGVEFTFKLPAAAAK